MSALIDSIERRHKAIAREGHIRELAQKIYVRSFGISPEQAFADATAFVIEAERRAQAIYDEHSRVES